MKFHHLLPLTVLISALLSGCFSTDVSDSNDVNQEKVYQRYKVFVKEDADDVECEAMFRFDSQYGNTLRLTAKSNVSVNGFKLSGDKRFLLGYVYETKIRKADNYTYSFVYTNNEEKSYANSIVVKPVFLSKSVPQKISKSEKLRIDWDGEKLSKGEELILQITVNDTSHLSVKVDRRNKQFRLNSSDFSGFAPGPGTMKIERSVKYNVSESNSAGGKIAGKYFTKSVNFELTE